MNRKKVIGDMGEKLALDFLLAKDYRLESKNYRYRHYEIDLILKQEELLVFVEVKTRKNKDFGLPEEAVDENKSAFLSQAIEAYLEEHNWEYDFRFDVIAISLEPSIEICHLEDVNL